MTSETYEIGPNAQIDDGVTLGYTYAGWSKKLRIGEHAIIRSGSILYVGSTIGVGLSLTARPIERVYTPLPAREA